MKNVLAIAPYSFLPANAGGQKAIFYLYQHLSVHVQLTVLSTKGNQVDVDPPIDFTLEAALANGVSRYINPVIVQHCRKIIRKKSIDTLLIEHPYMGFWGWVIKKITGKRLVVRSHNIEALRFKQLDKWWWKLLWYYEKWVHSRADFSFFITEEDRLYAEQHYGISPKKTMVVTYGMQSQPLTSPAQRQQRTRDFKARFKIEEHKTLLLFNGIFGYGPNDQALNCLLNEILPQLIKKDPCVFLIVCGKNIPLALEEKRTEHLLILGFVPDISVLFNAAEIFLNPIWLGGGIKTKLVEALAAGAAAVSFKSGAVGVAENLLAGKLRIVPDQDTEAFVQAIIQQKSNTSIQPPTSFYAHFNWDYIAARAAKQL